MNKRLPIALAVFGLSVTMGACGGSSDDPPTPPAPVDQFRAETLGLTPGSTETEVNFNWYADATGGDAAAVNLFGPDGKLIGTTQGKVSAAAAGKKAHKVTVSGLSYGTQYKYRVSNDNKNWSYEYSYTTPASGGGFTFASVGDPQLTTGNQDTASLNNYGTLTTAAGWQATMTKIAAAGASFIAGVGDQVDTGSNEQQWANYFAPAELHSIPIAAGIGNHEGANANFLWHFNLPNQQDSGGNAAFTGNYWYRYKNVLFVVLNTAPYPTADTVAPYIQRFGDTLKAATTASAGKYDWLIVQHHKPTTTVASHKNDADVIAYTPGLHQLMAQYKVDLVLTGHDHIYVRSHVLGGESGMDIINTTDSTAINKPAGGTMYLTFNTGSGLKYYDYDSAPDAGPLDKTATTAFWVQQKEPQYTIARVDGKTIKFTTTGTYTQTKLDEFTVSK